MTQLELFDHGYYWESHEVWESLWHAAGRTGPIADFLKGLIALAAAGVKVREGRAAESRITRAALGDCFAKWLSHCRLIQTEWIGWVGI